MARTKIGVSCERGEMHVRCYCDIFRSSKHQQFVQFSEQTFACSSAWSSLTSYCKFISFRAEQASQQHLDTETGSHQKVFKVVKSVKHFFPFCFLPLNFLTLLLSPANNNGTIWNRDFLKI